MTSTSLNCFLDSTHMADMTTIDELHCPQARTTLIEMPIICPVTRPIPIGRGLHCEAKVSLLIQTKQGLVN